MANEPKVPEVRDDDVDDVSDKLSIAAAMWSRGDRADALSWVRRAAEAASDAEQDLRALELAKAASELSAFVDQSGTHQAAAPAPSASVAAAPIAAEPPRKPPTAPPPKPSAIPPGKAPPHASSMPKKPPLSRPPGGKLPPLPPLRPLGSAPAPAKPSASPRVNSLVTSTSGATSASGTISREEPAPAPSKPMPWDEPMRDDEGEDEPTNQIALPEDDAPVPADMDATATREIAVMSQQPARDDAAPRSSPDAEATSEYDVSSRDIAPLTRRAAELSLAVGVRVRLVQSDHGVHVYPEGETTAGVAAIVVPLHADDDLRALFQRGE